MIDPIPRILLKRNSDPRVLPTSAGQAAHNLYALGAGTRPINPETVARNGLIGRFDESGLDIQQSRVRLTDAGSDFNLRFRDEGTVSDLAARGSLDTLSQRLDILVSGRVQDDGTADPASYDVRLAMGLDQIGTTQADEYPEPAGSLLRGLLVQLFERATAVQYPPNAVVINLGDIADLVSTGGTFRRVTRALMVLNRLFERAMREAQEEAIRRSAEEAARQQPDAPSTPDPQLRRLHFTVNSVGGPSSHPYKAQVR